MRIINLFKRKKAYFAAIVIINLIIIGYLIYLPYYLFDGRLFLGGDDTRFYYYYPSALLKSLSLFSWNNISSLPLYIPNHQYIPLLLVSTFFDNLLNSKIILSYSSFSAVLILGFIYFQKLVREIIGKEYLISIVGAVFYIFSPIIAASHLAYFLSPVWLVCLVPIIFYYYLCFLHRGEIQDVFKVVLWCIFLSLAFYAVVWIAGLLLPLFSAFIIFLIFVKNPLKNRVRKTSVFIFSIFASQLFWLFPFVMSLRNVGDGGLGVRPVSKEIVDSFAPTVLSIASGNIINPLLTFYHRQILFDFDGQLKNVFLNYYDYVLPLSLVFVVVLFIGLAKYKQVLKMDEKNKFIFFFIAFLAALYFFTINVGVLKNIFLFLGNIPGFSVFRNFIDKFSLGYIFIYAIFLTQCLFVIKRFFRFYLIFLVLVILVVIVNFIPIKQVVNRPVWRTNNIYQTVHFPKEYLDFAKETGSKLPKTENVIGFPQNIASYAIITEENGENAYVGTSPFKFLTGVNDLSGTASYPSNISNLVVESIRKRDYERLLNLLEQVNVGYVMVTRNIPDEVKKSYLFDHEYLEFQDDELIRSISDRELVRSESGKYIIYKLKNSPKVIDSTGEVSFEKINSVKYKVKIKNLDKQESLFFYETFNSGWKIFPGDKTYDNTVSGNIADILYLFKEPIFDESHLPIDPYGNKWAVDEDEVKNKIQSSSFVQNKDGSIDIIFTLYFLPQVYFYIGILMSAILLSMGFLYLYLSKKNEKS